MPPEEPKVLEVKGKKTTIVIRWSTSTGIVGGGGGGPGIEIEVGGGGGGGGPVVGQPVDGGGTVTNVSGSTVTIRFPNGLPTGPVRLPGTETTVVVEQIEETSSITTAPFGTGDTLDFFGLPAGPTFDLGTVSADALHKTFRLPCPGSKLRNVVLPFEHSSILINPTNTGNCPCSLFLASLTDNGQVVGPPVEIKPGETLPTYEIQPGASRIGAACSKGCTMADCFSELSISIPVG